MAKKATTKNKQKASILEKLNIDRKAIIDDYRLGLESRHVSIIGRREVLTGKAKFGIFGDGKEVAQLAMAKVFKDGDWRSGYYRDQTFMMAIGGLTLEQFFGQLYGDTSLEANPDNAGRLMNNHFATRLLDDNGDWKDQTKMKNTSADISPTAGQMPRLLGLAQASKIYRQVEVLKDAKMFSEKGNEVAFGTIGDASTSEGHFWETMNAAGVLDVPMAMFVWDDDYGISVHKKHQTVKQSISHALEGFRRQNGSGFEIFRVEGWNYEKMVEVFYEGVEKARKEHIPVLFHVVELTQPQGHSTSGSHERYKSKERLQWEESHDGIKMMREWMINEKIATEDELNTIEKEAEKRAKEARRNAWKHFTKPLKQKQKELLDVMDVSRCNCAQSIKIDQMKQEINKVAEPIRKDVISNGKKMLRLICDNCSNPGNSLRNNVTDWVNKELREGRQAYSSFLYSENERSASRIPTVERKYAEDAPFVPGREILRDNFDYIFGHYPNAMIFGEDVGKIGGVNQTLEGMQEKYGELRVADTGIREATIIGQGIGLALRGLRPIAEIQYFDYLLYGLQVISDDLATLHYRTKGGQKAPLIISTRGHRLEGIWHSGSPLSMVINSIRGVNVLVPRNMTQAAGFYNTMMKSDEPAVIIEPLNGYRLKEKRPENIGEYTTPVGVPEVLKQGKDVTIVTYGSCVRIAEDATKQLSDFGVDVELIDVQSLLPFDVDHKIVESLKKTNKIVFFDEDVPGGATAFMMQKVLENQKGYRYLDAEPLTITANSHRPAYSSDGDYFSNPNAEDVFEAVYNVMHDYNPARYPKIF
ncbi:MAG: thiamine pyrophosphate-dependent enzyme [Bacteroidales bacterium]